MMSAERYATDEPLGETTNDEMNRKERGNKMTNEKEECLLEGSAKRRQVTIPVAHACVRVLSLPCPKAADNLGDP